MGYMCQRLEDFDREIEYLNAELRRTRSKSRRSALEADIAQDRRSSAEHCANCRRAQRAQEKMMQ